MAASSTPLPIAVLLTEHEIARQFADALAGGYLGEQFFYWLPLLVEAWVSLPALACSVASLLETSLDTCLTTKLLRERGRHRSGTSIIWD